MVRQFHPATMSPVNHHVEEAEQEVSPAEHGSSSRKRTTRACDVSSPIGVWAWLMIGVQGVCPDEAERHPKVDVPESASNAKM